MKCLVSNPRCDGKGNIMTGDFTYTLCPCTYIRKAEEQYLLNGGNKRQLKFPAQLNNPKSVIYYENDPKTKLPFVGVLRQTVKDFPSLIHSQTKLHLIGKPGRGKTQFASSLLLLGFYYGYKGFSFDLRNARMVVRNERKLDELLKKIKQSHIVLLDDIGVEASGDWLEQDIENFIDYCVRQHEGLLILTSNILPEDLKKVYKDKRLIDAMLEEPKRTYIFTGENMRGANHE